MAIADGKVAYITPPFGYNLFLMRAMAPPEVTLGDIYRSIAPFILLMVLTLIWGANWAVIQSRTRQNSAWSLGLFSSSSPRKKSSSSLPGGGGVCVCV